MINFEVSKNTLQNPTKTRNGDYCKSEFLEDVNIVLLILCDGVGSNPCDWKASKIGCEKFIDEFKIDTETNIPQRFTNAIQKVNLELLLEVGVCENMKATLSAVVWEFDKQQFHFVNIGDSRIYEYSKDELIPITTDETKSVILRKKDGTPFIISGVAVIAEGITNVIGSNSLAFEVFSKSDKDTKGLVLASDGFYNASNQFKNHMANLFNALNFQSALDQLQSRYKETQTDDMTILAVRKVMENSNNIAIVKAILANELLSDWSDLELSKATLEGIENGIKNHEVQQVQKLLLFSHETNFDFGRVVIGNLISLMAKKDFQDRAVYQAILQMLRRSKSE